MKTFQHPDAHDRFEDGILFRLDCRPMAYVTGPDRREAALRLAARGLVTCAEGTGADAGILLVRRAPAFMRPGPGGDAA